MIHPTAIIDTRAQIDPSVQVGPHVIIDGPAAIAAGCRIEAHAQIVGDVRIGEGTVIGRAAIIGGEPQDLSFTPDTASGVTIGKNNVIREHVTIHRGSKAGSFTAVGDGNLLMAGCHLGHDVRIGDQNIIANAALFAGHVQLGSHAVIGGGAVFHQFMRLGDYCMVQGLAGASKDIPPFCIAHKINRIAGINVIGLRRAGFSGSDRRAIQDLFKLMFASGRNFSQALTAAKSQSWPEAAMVMLRFLEAPSKRGCCAMRGGGEQ